MTVLAKCGLRPEDAEVAERLRAGRARVVERWSDRALETDPPGATGRVVRVLVEWVESEEERR